MYAKLLVTIATGKKALLTLHVSIAYNNNKNNNINNGTVKNRNHALCVCGWRDSLSNPNLSCVLECGQI